MKRAFQTTRGTMGGKELGREHLYDTNDSFDSIREKAKGKKRANFFFFFPIVFRMRQLVFLKILTQMRLLHSTLIACTCSLMSAPFALNFSGLRSAHTRVRFSYDSIVNLCKFLL